MADEHPVVVGALPIVATKLVAADFKSPRVPPVTNWEHPHVFPLLNSTIVDIP